MKVLLTDDSMTIRLILRNLLKELGITDITEGKNGQEALDLLMANRFDMVLIDIHMPKVDGLTVLERIKTDPASINKDVPVVIISSDTDYRQIERARGLSAFGYIKKPFKKKGLQAALKAAEEAEKRRQRAEAEAEAEAIAIAREAPSQEAAQPVSGEKQPAAAGTTKKRGGLYGWMRKVFRK